MSSKRNRGALSIAVISGLVLVSGGAVLGQILFPSNAPEVLQDGETTESFTAEETSFDDARTVQLSLEIGEDRELVVPNDGRVTATACEPGGVIASGFVAGSVSGASVLALHTSVPLWESLAPGDSGDDVNALRRELVRFGADLAEEGAVDAAMLSVVGSLFSGDSAQPEPLEDVPIDRVMWIPQPEVTMLECAAAVGADVQHGDPYGTVAGPLLGAAVQDTPADLAPGPRTLRVAGVEAEVDAAGAVTSPEALAAIAATDGFQASRGALGDEGAPAAPTMVAELALTSQMQAWTIPATTVFDVTDGLGCVTSGDTVLAVKIVGSQFGKTFVVPAESAARMPATVRVPETTVESCTEQP